MLSWNVCHCLSLIPTFFSHILTHLHDELILSFIFWQMQWNGNAGQLNINGTYYKLIQCHWHTPSEHTLNGRKWVCRFSLSYSECLMQWWWTSSGFYSHDSSVCFVGLPWNCMQSIKTLKERLLLLEYGTKLVVQIACFQRFAVFLNIVCEYIYTYMTFTEYRLLRHVLCRWNECVQICKLSAHSSLPLNFKITLPFLWSCKSQMEFNLCGNDCVLCMSD